MKGGLAADELLELVLAGDVARVAVGGQDVPDLDAFQLLGDLFDRQPWVDDDRLLGARAGEDITVDLAIELDLDDGELGHASLFTGMEQVAAVGFGVVLVLVCLFWAYGYFRRRSRKRYSAATPGVPEPSGAARP